MDRRLILVSMILSRPWRSGDVEPKWSWDNFVVRNSSSHTKNGSPCNMEKPTLETYYSSGGNDFAECECESEEI